MAEGTNLDFILSTDYLSVDDQKILNEKKEAEKITLGEAFDTTSASSGQITRRAETRIEMRLILINK